MKYKKFILIPLLILIYLYLVVPLLVSISFETSGESGDGGQNSGIVNIGFSSTVSVSVTRPYLFGLIELPVYSSSLGDISFLHTAFFVFIIALTIIFVIIERRKKHG